MTKTFPERFLVVVESRRNEGTESGSSHSPRWLTGGRFINYFRKKGGKVFPITVFCEGLPRATRQGVRLMATRAHRSSSTSSSSASSSSSSSSPSSTPSSTSSAVSLPILQGPPTPPTRRIFFFFILPLRAVRVTPPPSSSFSFRCLTSTGDTKEDRSSAGPGGFILGGG